MVNKDLITVASAPREDRAITC